MNRADDTNSHILRTLRLLGLASIRGLKQREQVDLLDRAGYGQKEIAELLNSTSKAISVRLAELRKKRKERQRAAVKDD